MIRQQLAILNNGNRPKTRKNASMGAKFFLAPCFFTPFHTFSWEQRKFSELTEIRSASRVHKDEWQSSGVPFYRSSDVMAALNGTENEKAFISEELYEKLSAVSGKLEKGDVLVTGGGSVGKPYIVPNNEPLYTKDADLLWIKNNENLDPYFVYTFFFSPTFTDYLNSVSHVGTIAHYTITQLGETPITLPCVSEQQKIGDYFRNLDFLITLHQREYKWTVLSYQSIMFHDFNLSWEQRKLGELAVEVKRKAEKDSDASVMMISAAEGFIDQSQRYSNNNAGSSLKNYTLLYEGELAYNHGYSKFRNFGSVFDLRVEKARIPFVYHSFALPEDDHRFYAYYLNSGLFDGELKKLVSSTARMDGLLNISYEDYMSIPVLRPPVKEQEKIGRFLTSLDDLITLHQREPPKEEIINERCKT